MSNEKFLMIICISLALLVGALLHTIYLLGKDKKLLSNKLTFSERFLHVLFNYLHKDGIDVNKYADIVMNKLTEKKGGEENE